jgi:hypothetical protein
VGFGRGGRKVGKEKGRGGGIMLLCMDLRSRFLDL